MRRIAIALTLSAGCFGEPPDNKTASTAGDSAVETSGESSSSDDGSSSTDGESSSTGEPDPSECPEWCADGCDVVLGLYAECRCVLEQQCEPGGLSCDRPDGNVGHCR